MSSWIRVLALAQARLSGGKMKRGEPKRRRHRARPETVGTDIMTLHGAAEYLHCNPMFVYILLKNGELPGPASLLPRFE